MGRSARTAREKHRVLLRHSSDGHTEWVNRPTLLKKRPASNDLRHARLDEREDWSPLANAQESHSSSREFRAWLAQEPHPSSEKERQPPPEPNGRFCRPAVALLERRPSRWQDNCNGRTHHTPCNETSLPGASSCPDRGLLGRLGRGAAELEASSAPTRHHLFECSWEASIRTDRPKNKTVCQSLTGLRPSSRLHSSNTYRHGQTVSPPSCYRRIQTEDRAAPSS